MLYNRPSCLPRPPIHNSNTQLVTMLDDCEVELKKLMFFDRSRPPCKVRLKVHEHTLCRSREVATITDAASCQCSSHFSQFAILRDHARCIDASDLLGITESRRP